MGCAGQYGLAYVTAATYGLDEDAVRLAGTLQEAGVDPLPDLEPGGGLLLAPPAPILHEANWPLLTVQKGFFETLAAGTHRPVYRMYCHPSSLPGLLSLKGADLITALKLPSEVFSEGHLHSTTGRFYMCTMINECLSGWGGSIRGVHLVILFKYIIWFI